MSTSLKTDLVLNDGDRRSAMRRILDGNHGFKNEDLEHWVSFGLAKGFKPVRAEPIRRCPDCGSGGSKWLGQSVHYSTLLALCKCEKCGLIFMDAKIDPEVITQHFELTYKDEEYFKRRLPVFKQIAEIVVDNLPLYGRVLDIGGATGELLAEIRSRRGDAVVVLSDLSARACREAEDRFGIRTFCGSISSIGLSTEKFDVIIASDVLYYEHDINGAWNALSRLLKPDGTIVLRGPNKASLILGLLAFKRRFRRQQLERSASIKFLNVEHVLLLTRSYLNRKLNGLGFRVRTYPSRVLGENVWLRLWYRCASMAAMLTRGRVILSPAVIFVAKRG